MEIEIRNFIQQLQDKLKKFKENLQKKVKSVDEFHQKDEFLGIWDDKVFKSHSIEIIEDFLNSGSNDVVLDEATLMHTFLKEVESDLNNQKEEDLISAYAQLRDLFIIECLLLLGERNSKPLLSRLRQTAAQLCSMLLVKYAEVEGSDLAHILDLITIYASDRIFAAKFAILGGIQRVVRVPKTHHNLIALSKFLFTIEGYEDILFGLDHHTIPEIVQLGLHLLQCEIEEATNYAAIYFGFSFIHQAFVNSFCLVNGWRMMLSVLQDLDLGYGEKKLELGYHMCYALQRCFGAILRLLLTDQRNRMVRFRRGDLDLDSINDVFLQLQNNINLASSLFASDCLEFKTFILCNGHDTLLSLCQKIPTPTELLPYALNILGIIALVPCGHKAIVNAGCNGIGVILETCRLPEYHIKQHTLFVLLNLVCPLATEVSVSQARNAVRSCNGICIVLQCLQMRVVLQSATLDCIRTLACRVLLGLARDDTIAHLLTKLEVGERLSQLIKDMGSKCPGTEQKLWRTELTKAATELITVVTDSGSAGTLAAINAATPTLQLVQRAAIAAATPVTYNPRELLLLIQEHLQACGLSTSAATLMKEAQLIPLPSLSALSSPAHHACAQEMPSIDIEWPSGRVPGGFLNKASKILAQNDTTFAPSHLGLSGDLQLAQDERVTLDSIIVRYLKYQHCQCPAPKTTLPPLSLLRSHVCQKSKRSLDAPSNMTVRLSTREFRSTYGGFHRKDCQYVYSRFRPWRVYREAGVPFLTSITILQTSSEVLVGTQSGNLKFFSTEDNTTREFNCHQYPVLHVQSHAFNGKNLVLSSASHEVNLCEANSSYPRIIEGCKAANFSNSGKNFAALPSETSQREVLLFDVETSQLCQRLEDTVVSLMGRVRDTLVHFDESDNLCLWNGLLWDRRVRQFIHNFDLISDFGGGGFHPIKKEVIVNSEIWDLRSYSRLLRSVPTLNETCLTFNSNGSIIYAWSRRNLTDILDTDQPPRHPLVSAFRTLDAFTYADIATIHVDGRILCLAQEPTESFIGLVSFDSLIGAEEILSSATLYSIGCQNGSDDDLD